MSRVTINDLAWDYRHNTMQKELTESCDIEVVPRKIVEMIIEECERNKITNIKYGNYCAADNLKHIREYAESLLKQFEEGGKVE